MGKGRERGRGRERERERYIRGRGRKRKAMGDVCDFFIDIDGTKFRIFVIMKDRLGMFMNYDMRFLLFHQKVYELHRIAYIYWK
jgi:hypothetical protein